MRVKVRFRFNGDTGEVEAFVVEDLSGGQVGDAEHEARHSRAAADVARVIEQNTLIEEFVEGEAVSRDATSHADPVAPRGLASPDEGLGERRDRGLRE